MIERDCPNDTKSDRLTPSVKLVYDYLLANKDKICSMKELIRIGDIYESTNDIKVSPSDMSLVRYRVSKSREYLEHTHGSKLSIYGLRETNSYVLSDNNSGEYFNLPLEWRYGMEALTPDDFDFLSQCKINRECIIVRRLSGLKLDIFLTLCASHVNNPGKFVSAKEIWGEVFDRDTQVKTEKETMVRLHINQIRKKLEGSNMKIVNKPSFGYKFSR